MFLNVIVVSEGVEVGVACCGNLAKFGEAQDEDGVYISSARGSKELRFWP